MKLIFKQRLFSFLDSYDIFDENDQVVFTVKSKLNFGRHYQVFYKTGEMVGELKQKIFCFLPTFEIFLNDIYTGCVSREFSFFKPRYIVDYKDWLVEGNFFEWDYTIKKYTSGVVATVTKELFNFTDTYTIDVVDEKDVIPALMLVLAIDAEKDQRDN